MGNLYTAFEGGEGVGKSSLAANYATSINAYYTVEPNREIEECKKLYDVCVRQNVNVTKAARELMLLASRSMSMAQMTPRILAGQSVVSDRSFLSGAVYAQFEGFTKETWFEIAELSGAIVNFPDRIVYVTANGRKATGRDDKPSDDKYDDLDERDHDRIHNLFLETIDFAKTFYKERRNIDLQFGFFEVDFSKSENENLSRFMSQIWRVN